ncbi:MAG TPA: TrmH family RNA methyltransferase [Polyangiaceae bacterium]|nr:TrmH family RNA methyltransferase [Polyangiaceae bacterium]
MRRATSPGLRQPLRQVFETLDDPEPVIAVLEPLAREERRARLQQVIAERLDSVTVAMDAPHDPHNGAAVMRSCDAFGVYRIHVVERVEAFSASGAVAKGSERWVDVVPHRDVASAVESLRRSGHVLVGTHPDGERTPDELASIPRLALVMGNEHDGICEELAAACEERVRVPMRGFVESLNVSVTAAILLSHATQRREGDLPTLTQRRLYAKGLTLSVPRALDVLAARGIELL